MWPPWTVACQAPLSMGFSRQEYWSGWVAIPFSEGSYLPRYRTCVSWIVGRLFTIWATREALVSFHFSFCLMISLFPWLRAHAVMMQMAQLYRARPISEFRAVVLVASIHWPGKLSLWPYSAWTQGTCPPARLLLATPRSCRGGTTLACPLWARTVPCCPCASCSCSHWPFRPSPEQVFFFWGGVVAGTSKAFASWTWWKFMGIWWTWVGLR